MTDVVSLWDFADPAGSEARFRAAAAAADGTDRAVLLTQVARALGLQGRYDDAHALLDAIEPSTGEILVRLALERGDPLAARPCFDTAVDRARAAGLDALLVDALHMVALVAGPDEAAAVHAEALAVARASADPIARDWDASLLNNIGMAHADAGDHAAALNAFTGALAARERIGDPARTRVARWMVAWSLRHLGRTGEARRIQRTLRAELAALGESDPDVDEELALLGD